jgi:hypothetical protein
MNRIDEIVIVLSSGLSLLGLAYVYFWLYRDYRRDLLRTRLFKIRAELFDAAQSGRIDFNHPAYGLLRSTLNGFLRYGHKVGAFRLVMTALFLDPTEMEELYPFKSQWQEAVRSLDSQTRDWLEELREQVHVALFTHLLATTGFVYLFMVLWLAVLETQKRPRRSQKHPKRHDGMGVSGPPASFKYRLDSVAFANAH